MEQIISFNELCGFGKIQALSNMPVLAIDKNSDIRYINSIGENWLALAKNGFLDKTKSDLTQLLTNDNYYKWESFSLNVENETWSLYIGKSPESDLSFNNRNTINNFIENFPELVYWKDSNLLYQGCNKNAANILGYKTPTEILGKSDIDLAKKVHWTDDRVKKLRDTDTAIIEQGISTTEEDPIPGLDHTRIYLTSKKPLYNDEKIVGILGISTDITDRKSIEEGFKNALEKNKLYLHGIIESLPQLVYWKDVNLIYQGCNKFCAEILNLKNPADIVGKSDYNFNWTEQRIKELHDIDQKILTHGTSSTVEDIIPIKNTSRIFLTSKTPLIDDNGNIIGILGISTDITQRKKMEEDLRKAKEAAEKAKYMMTEFISNMGHDLATPITDVETVVMMLDEYADEYPELKDILQTLTERAAACEAVRKRILNATSLSNLEVKLETFSVIEVILALEKKFRPEIDGKKLKLVIHPLKPKKEDVITADREKFSAILEELLLNAIHFTDEGGVSISIVKENDIIDIEVSDTGMGIPADKFDYIFEPYTKLAASNQFGQTFKGPGCGLYLVEVRANILGASINVKSALGKGSTFTLSIPVHPEK